jgi:predicted esterase
LGGTLNARGRAVCDDDDRFERRWMLSEEEGANAETRARQIGEASSKVRRALRVLRDEHGWDLTRVHLFGFSDGGAVALDVAASMTGTERLGGCVAVAAAALEPQVYPPCAEAPTPVLFIAGTRDEVVPIERVRETAAAFARRHHGCGAEVHEFDKTHGMISSAPEVQALMTFWGKTYKYSASKASDYGDDVVELRTAAS